MSAEQDKKKGHDGHSHDSHKPHDTASWVLTGPWAGAWKIFAGIGAVGLGLSAVGFVSDTRRFAFSWMFAYITVLAIALGSIFFVLIQRLTSAGWSVTVRRTAELFGYGVLALIPLFIPVILTMGHLFPWIGEGHDAKAHDKGGEHGSISLITPAYAQAPNGNHGSAQGVPSDTGAVHGGGMVDPGAQPHGNTPDAKEHAEHQAHAKIHDGLMEKKSGWLNKNFFYVRALLYFLI